MIAQTVGPTLGPTLGTHLYPADDASWGVVLDESGGWVVGYALFAPGICGRYQPLAWPLRANQGRGVFRTDGALAFRGRCAFLPANGLLENDRTRALPRDVTLVIRRDGSHALEVPAE